MRKRQRVNWNRKSVKKQTSNAFDVLANTSQDTSKTSKRAFSVAENVVYKNGNLVPRNGVLDYVDVSNCVGLSIHTMKQKSPLYAFELQGTSTDIVEISRTEVPIKTPIVSISGTKSPSTCTLGDFFWVANGSLGLYKVNHDGRSKSNLDVSASNVHLVAQDGSRLWTVSNIGTEVDVLRHSTATRGIGTSFEINGTSLTRAGVCNMEITNAIDLVGVNKVMVVFGENRIEGHATPDTFGDYTTYAQGAKTRQWAVDGFGVENMNQAVSVAGKIYFKPKNKQSLWQLNPLSGKLTDLGQTEQLFERLNHENAVMSYDSLNGLVYYSCTNEIQGDTTVVYNIAENQFSVFKGFYAKYWASDEKNTYLKSSVADMVQRAFKKDQLTDNNFDIVCRIRSNDEPNGDETVYKKAYRWFWNIRTDNTTSITTRFFVDQAQGVDGVPVYENTTEIQVDNDGNLVLMNGLYNAPLGLRALETPNKPPVQELIKNDEQIGHLYVRGAIEIEFRTRGDTQIKSFGYEWQYTDKQNKYLTLKTS